MRTGSRAGSQRAARAGTPPPLPPPPPLAGRLTACFLPAHISPPSSLLPPPVLLQDATGRKALFAEWKTLYGKTYATAAAEAKAFAAWNQHLTEMLQHNAGTAIRYFKGVWNSHQCRDVHSAVPLPLLPDTALLPPLPLDAAHSCCPCRLTPPCFRPHPPTCSCLCRSNRVLRPHLHRVRDHPPDEGHDRR